jgi:hypothetical protein
LQLRGLCVAVLTLVLTGGLCKSLQAAGLNFRVGVGYDFLSQQYFLDSASLGGPDSLLTDWALKTNYLDDVKGQFALTFNPYNDRRLELQSSYEQTPEFMRMRFGGDLRSKFGATKLDFNSELEWRDRYRDSSDFGDSYLSGYFKTRLSTPVSVSTTAKFQIQTDGVNFRSPSDFSYNYYRLGGKAALTKSYENFSFADVRLFVMTRQVPDSLELNYLNFGVEGSLFGFYDGVELDLFTRLERKDYNQLSNKDDHNRFELSALNKVNIGQSWLSRQELDIELVFYSSVDPVNYDYGRVGLALLYGYENNGVSVAVGPDFEYLDEQENDLLESEDYFESGAKIDLDYMKMDGLFYSIESILGYRNLKYESELQSDFSFERLNVIADVRILSVLSLSVLFSAEWEWHQQKEENSQVYLLSSSLGYAF